MHSTIALERLLRIVRRSVMTALLLASLVMAASVALPIAATVQHSRLVIVEGASMEPTYDIGEAFFAKVGAPVDKGDVVTFTNGSNVLTTHRVVAIEDVSGGTFLRTKGDNNATEDPVLTPITSVIGVAGAAIPFGELLTEPTQSPFGRLLVFGTPLLLLAISQLLSLVVVRDRVTSSPGSFWEEHQTRSEPVDDYSVVNTPAG